MNKSRVLTCTLSAMLISVATIGWTGTALAQQAAQTDVTGPVVVIPMPPAAPQAAAAAAPAAPAPAQEAAVPATAVPATSAPAQEAAAPAAEAATTEETTEDKSSYRGRYGWRRGHDRYAEQRKAIARARHNEMERWRSMRRWWNNPEAEDRRQWNKARNRAHRDMAEARRSYYDMNRPYGDYGYGGRRSYRGSPWY